MSVDQGDTKNVDVSESDTVSRIGVTVLASIPTFSGAKEEQARRFMKDFEEALDLANVNGDKYKKYWFKTKLRGLPSEWYETTRDNPEYRGWSAVKTAFLHQFDKTTLRPKDVIMRLMGIRQDVEEEETIQSLSIRITHLFNEYQQTMKKGLSDQEKVEYFIEALFPSYKEQLNNQYQSEDGVSYSVSCTFDDVLTTALKLERNARAYEEDVQHLPGMVAQMKINAVHKAVNPKTQIDVKGDMKFKKNAGDSAMDMGNQNADDIMKIQKEQLIIKDQLTAVSHALTNFGEQMRSMRASIENIRYERVYCPGTVNPMYNHRFRGGTHNSNDVRNNSGYAKRYDDPRLYNAARASDGKLQVTCYTCGQKGHYSPACPNKQRMQKGGENHPGTSTYNNVNKDVQREQPQAQDSRITQGNMRSDQKDVQNTSSHSGPVTRSQSTVARMNHVSIISHTRSGEDNSCNTHLLIMRGQIGKTELTNVVFDNGAAVSCLNASVFHCLDSSIKSKLSPCGKEKQLTNATGGVMNSLGELIVDIKLEGPSGLVTFKELSVVVVNDLQSEMLFGADVLTKEEYKSYKVDLHCQHIEFEDKDEKKTLVSYQYESIGEVKAKRIPVYLLKNTLIPANSSLIANAAKWYDNGLQEQDMLFNACEEGLGISVHAENTLFNHQISKAVPIILTNVDNIPYTVKGGTVIGSCHVIEDEAVERDSKECEVTRLAGPVINNVSASEEIIETAIDSGVKNIKNYDFTTIENMDAEKKQKLKSLLMKYSYVFSDRPFGSGTIGLMEHTIELTDANVKPIKHYGYRVSPTVAAELQENVEQMRKLGVIEESQSPWASPVLLVPKKDGTRRFCTDFRQLNAVTKGDVFPLPRIDNIMDKLGGCKYFTSIDLKHAFWQIKMREEDKEKTSFICGNRLWQYRRMAFGLKNSPATFQRCISMAIGENGYSLAYLDDIIIFSRSVEDHFTHIESILNSLVKHNLNAKINKCEFFKTSLTFLGHIVSRSGISVCPDKVRAVREFPVPQNMKELRSFLGLGNYYRRFILDYSRTTSVLTRLLQKNVNYEWTEECQLAFDELKEKLTQAPVLAFPDYALQFILTTDACDSGIGGVLSQSFDGVEKPVVYLSRTLNEHEKNYATTHKECLAIVWCIKQCEHYLLGKKFIIRTDHNALKWLMSVKDHNGKLMRWALTLMEFEFEIQHVKGKTNFVADALSRAPVNIVVTVNKERKENDKEDAVEVPEGDRLDHIKQIQLEDDELTPIIHYLIDGTLPEDEKQAETIARKTLNKYAMIDGTLYHLWQQSNSFTHPRLQMVEQLVIPKSLRKEILYACHEDLFSGHGGVKRTYERLRGRFYWDNMYRDTVEHVRSCLDCEMKKFPTNKGSIVPLSLTHGPVYEPCQDWCVDLCGPFPLSRNGNRYACVFMDRFSRFPEAFGIKDKKAATVAKVLVKEIVCRYGCPRTLLSDRGGEFMSELSNETYRLMNIKKLNTSGYRPQTNGMVEKFNHTLIQAISQYISGDQRDWDEFLPYACFQYRSNKNETTNESPYYMLFCRDMKMPLDRVYCKDEEFTSTEAYLKEVTERFRESKEIFEKQRREIENEKKRFNDSIRKTLNFDIGEVVLILKRYVKKGQVKKLTHLWKGPYVVVNKFGNRINYEVQLLKSGKDKHVVHASNMKRFHEPHLTHLSKKLKPLEEEEEDEKHSVEYEVESILDRKYENGENYYLVRWKDYDSSANTWEPIKNLIHSREIIKKFELEREAHEKGMLS